VHFSVVDALNRIDETMWKIVGRCEDALKKCSLHRSMLINQIINESIRARAIYNVEFFNVRVDMFVNIRHEDKLIDSTGNSIESHRR
jgi:hypothetical protein